MQRAPFGGDASKCRPGLQRWPYLTISVLAALEPIPVFKARKLAPVQSFAHSAPGFSALRTDKKLRESLNRGQAGV
jgi:hypothetical protein